MNTIEERKHPALAKASPYLVLIIVWAVMPAFVSTSFWLHTFIIVFIRIVGAVGLRTISLSGNLSFAQAGFVGVGAYVAGILGKVAGLPVGVTIPVATLCATALGVATGFPFVRLRTIYFSMATMFLGVAIVYVISALKITGGTMGMKGIPQLFPGAGMMQYYYFFFILAVVSCAVMYRFEFSRVGMILQALAQSKDAAAAMGVSEVFYRLLAVGVGSFFAGLVGACYAHYNAALSPSSFGMSIALWFIMYVMIGGKDSFIGPILGTILLVLVPEFSRSFSLYAPYVTAAALVVVAYAIPGGLASLPEVIKNAMAKKREGIEAHALKGGA
jgi:branched-chain amino acid transport system permease protein